jgi:hypothetical protein
MPDRGAPRGGWAPAGTGGRAGRWSLRLVAHLSPELDHLFLKVDHSLGAHGCQSNEFHDYRPYPAVAGKGFVELGEPVEEFPSDNGFGIEVYPPHFAERREVGCFFGMGLHLSSVGRLPRRVGRKNLSWQRSRSSVSTATKPIEPLTTKSNRPVLLGKLSRRCQVAATRTRPHHHHRRRPLRPRATRRTAGPCHSQFRERCTATCWRPEPRR